MAEITITNLGKTIGNLHTLDDISLTVRHNEFVVILGPSGCGKSTLLHIISGLLKPDRGSIEIDGEDWTGRTGRIGYMQQEDLLLPWLKLLDNAAIPLILKGISKKQAPQLAGKHLKDFGLQGFEDYYPRQLSVGMRQRAALLRTYLFSSDILLLDEPFAALDAINRRKMQLWLKNWQENFQSAILLVTHDIEEALLLANRIYIFSARPARVKLELDLNQPPRELHHLKNEIINLLEQEADD